MNIWDKVRTTYTAYIDAVCKEQLANVSLMSARHADPKSELCRTKFVEWESARKRKSEVYVEHVRVVGEAVKSGIPCPW